MQAKKNWEWKKVDTIIIGDCQTKPSELIASFDMDDTLIKIKSGAKFPKDAQDWVLWDTSVPLKLRELYNEGYKIVIFTNQHGITSGKTNAEHIKKKIQDFSQAVEVPIQAFIACGDDQYRKPSVNMWTYLEKNMNGGIKINKEKSLFCGDAAGRKTKTHNDFGESDLKFALNVGVPFKVPQVLFLNEKEEKLEVRIFDPKTIPTEGHIFEGENKNEVEFRQKQMLIFCGPPGGGKSTFWSTYLPKYTRISLNNLKTKQDCYNVAEQEMKQGKSVVIDNGNPLAADRAFYLQLAKKYNYSARCFYFTTSKDICFHNDHMRVVNDKRKHFSGKTGGIPIHIWFNTAVQPKIQEGFTEVKKVNFIAKFNDEVDKEVYLTFIKK